ncbi:MAG TPA: adenylosuccinate synthase [Candidatus Binataceae bacterium]|jgi:adenylosuccinate synthase|nr:adenylosuccinate synthase [Candidatus Binataceae bacterium]
MKTVAVVGTQWGDEGKGKIVDLLAADADIVVRFQGGNNAAHTLVVDGQKFILRLVPAGALHPGKTCVIGNGTVVDPFALIEELDKLRANGYLAGEDSFKLSYDAHMVMPYHRAIDRGREARLGTNAIGTTGFGIGPAYEDKVARSGLRFADLVDFRSFTARLERNLADKNAYLKSVLKAKPIKTDELVAQMKVARKRLMPCLADTASFIYSAQEAGKRMLFEGAHGAMLDIDFGTYPYVTSSTCLASAAYAGAGLPPGKLDAVLGISKAYTTRVGGGPFPSEIKTSLGKRLREEGDEFGSATGRPRRIGWFDAVLARHALRLNGAWGLALTKLDVLTGIDPLRICIAYERASQRYNEMPPGRIGLDKVRPIYEDLPGWHESLQGARSLNDLPAPARRYLDRIADLTAVPLAMVGTGAAREATIMLSNPFLD